MRNIKLVLEYDGSRYDGWQKQAQSMKSITVEDKIEAVLSKMEGEQAEVIGGARTEEGVHAYGQVANFKTGSEMKLHEIKQYLNRFLPMDIAVLEIEEVPERFHSAFGARGFVYEYHVSMGEVPSVFNRKFNYYSFKALNTVKMKGAAAALIGKHDFRAFSDNRRMKKSTVREMTKIDLYGDDQELVIAMTADDFWPHMARIIAGTLLEIGKGAMEPEKMKEILEGGDRELAGPTAEAKGLFLREILY